MGYGKDYWLKNLGGGGVGDSVLLQDVMAGDFQLRADFQVGRTKYSVVVEG